MLTIEQLSKETKQRVIMILTEDGVTKQSIQACAFGIACDNLGIANREDSLARLEEVGLNRRQHNREYVNQALTIYSNAVAGEMIDLLTLVGGEIPADKMGEMKLNSDRVIKEIIDQYLPKFVEN